MRPIVVAWVQAGTCGIDATVPPESGLTGQPHSLLIQGASMSYEHLETCVSRVHGLDPTSKLVLVLLAWYCRKPEFLAWPSVPTLADQCCISERQAQRTLRGLAKSGWIEILERRVDGRQRSNYYKVNMERARGDMGDTPQPVDNSPMRGDTSDTRGVTFGASRGDMGGNRGVTPTSPELVLDLEPVLIQPVLEPVARANPETLPSVQAEVKVFLKRVKIEREEDRTAHMERERIRQLNLIKARTAT